MKFEFNCWRQGFETWNKLWYATVIQAFDKGTKCSLTLEGKLIPADVLIVEEVHQGPAVSNPKMNTPKFVCAEADSCLPVLLSLNQ